MTSRIANAAPPNAWSWAMVLASTLYLLPEAIFNAQLVNVAGQGIFSEHQLRNVELFGRAVSGIGVSLLICDALGGKLVRGGQSALILIVGVFALVWPAVFFGQKILVDELIINPSTSEQRQHAVVSNVIRGALSENAIRIEGVDYDPDHDLNPQEMTFMALFGGMVFADQSLAETIDSKKSDVVHDMVAQRAYADFDQHWRDYEQMYDAMKSHYESYAEGSRQYNEAINSIPSRQKRYWEDVQTQITEGWEEYQSATKAHRARAHTKAERHADDLYDDLSDMTECDSERCAKREIRGYEDTLADLGFSDVDVDHWYRVREISTWENIANTVVGGVLTGGALTALQAIDAVSGGDGGFKDKKYYTTNETAHYAEKILELDQYKQQFVERTGYPRGIEKHWNFRSHPETAKQVRQKLANKGLNLPQSWQVNDKAGFDKAVDTKVRNEARKRWQAEMDKQGLDIPPNLSWERFQKQPDIQQRIKEQMGEYYVNPTYAHWNKKTFKERVVDHHVKSETEAVLQRMEAAKGTFADGKPNEDIGKEMMRAVIVPPISMGLSLLLVILTLVKLPKKYFALLARKSEAKIDTDKRKKLLIKGSFSAITFVAIFTVPLFLWSNDYTSQGSTVHYFLEKTEEHGSKGARFALNWILHAQPVMHPLGDTLNKYTGFYELFSENNQALDRLDQKVLGQE